MSKIHIVIRLVYNKVLGRRQARTGEITPKPEPARNKNMTQQSLKFSLVQLKAVFPINFLLYRGGTKVQNGPKIYIPSHSVI